MHSFTRNLHVHEDLRHRRRHRLRLCRLLCLGSLGRFGLLGCPACTGFLRPREEVRGRLRDTGDGGVSVTV
jgi:hypothetical protein